MSAPKVVAIIQARMGSSRLPGKVLADLNGQPVLAWVLRRTQRAAGIHQVAVAAPAGAEDDPLAVYCAEHGVTCVRGSLHDVLDRYVQAARETQADVIVRITGDCPFIDPGLLGEYVQKFVSADPPLDFAANRLPQGRTIPIGLDVELCTRAALETAWAEAKEPHQREHVMPFFYEHPERFNIAEFTHEPSYGELRWTVDTPEDLELARAIAGNFPDDTFSWKDILALFEAKPELANINAAVQHKDYRQVDERR
ncbi:MAG: glycosyltransferase family protein [Anaerolineales bacterium]|nr:glycosyltransferase family protein [Anaerolineales bacterium]